MQVLTFVGVNFSKFLQILANYQPPYLGDVRENVKERGVGDGVRGSTFEFLSCRACQRFSTLFTCLVLHYVFVLSCVLYV